MNSLISALIDKNALGEDSIITASYTVKDNTGRSLKKIGDFGIISSEKQGDDVNLTLQHLIEKNKVQISQNNIIAIDGMDPKRYADIYDLNSDGSNKKIGKKRGRKPKVR